MRKLITTALLGATALLAAQAAPAAASTASSPHATKMQGWKTKNYTATICAFRRPFWGRESSWDPRCHARFTLTGRVAYNGREAWGQKIEYSKGGGFKVKVKKTWLGYWNNGARKAPHYMQLGANGHTDMVYRNGDFYIRISVDPNGKARLSGGPR